MTEGGERCGKPFIHSAHTRCALPKSHHGPCVGSPPGASEEQQGDGCNCREHVNTVAGCPVHDLRAFEQQGGRVVRDAAQPPAAVPVEGEESEDRPVTWWRRSWHSYQGGERTTHLDFVEGGEDRPDWGDQSDWERVTYVPASSLTNTQARLAVAERALDAVLFKRCPVDHGAGHSAVQEDPGCEVCVLLWDYRRRAEAAEARLAEAEERIEQLEEGAWPWEWQVATKERERRKAAEAERDEANRLAEKDVRRAQLAVDRALAAEAEAENLRSQLKRVDEALGIKRAGDKNA